MTGKTTLTRVTHLVARVFVWPSFRQQAAGGPSLRRHRFPGRGKVGGEFPPRSPTVLTAAYWSDIASLLKRDTSPAARAGARGCRAEGARHSCQTRAQRGGRWWVSFTQLCQSLRCSVMCACMCVKHAVCMRLSIHLPLSFGLLHLLCDRCPQTVDIFSNT